MTVAAQLHHAPYDDWTVDDLADLPDNGQRYELLDGSLLVSPMPKMPHLRTVTRLRNVLKSQAPAHLEVGENGGVLFDTRRTYLVPDLWVAPTFALEGAGYFRAGDLLLVVEVHTGSNSPRDTVTKRHYYAAGGIPHYWIVDMSGRSLTALRLDGDRYVDEAVVKPDGPHMFGSPFAVTVDLDHIL